MDTRLTEKDVLDFLNEWELFKKKKLKEEEKPILERTGWNTENDSFLASFSGLYKTIEVSRERLSEILIAESKGELMISSNKKFFEEEKQSGKSDYMFRDRKLYTEKESADEVTQVEIACDTKNVAFHYGKDKLTFIPMKEVMQFINDYKNKK